MDDALTESKQRFAQEFVSSSKLDIEPLVADQWVVTSLLQNPSAAVRLRRRSEPHSRSLRRRAPPSGGALW
ncbi:MAG: hypothetical protein WBL43_17745 [Pseudolabrys sp.]